MICFDSNVLIYSVAPPAISQSERARDLIARSMRAGTGVLLLQTLAEFSNVMVRKMGLPAADVKATVEAWRSVLKTYPAAEEDIAVALDTVRRHHLQFWDAMLWAAARRIGVRHFLTEDLQDGRLLDGVRFINPFDPANDRIIDRFLPA